jgi:hypothetical protein
MKGERFTCQAGTLQGGTQQINAHPHFHPSTTVLLLPNLTKAMCVLCLSASQAQSEVKKRNGDLRNQQTKFVQYQSEKLAKLG